jgi:hypothetical protein
MSDQDSFLNGIEIWDTSLATSSSASLYTYGGLSILTTADSTDLNGGSFLSLGGGSITKNLNIGGITTIFNTIQSTDTSTGSLIIKGGLAIQGNAFGGFGSFTNFQATTSATIPNLVAPNVSISNLTLTGAFSPANITCTNLVSTNSSLANAIFTNITATNLNVQTITSTNAIISILTAGSLNLTNISSINETVANLLATTATISNILNSTNIINTNITSTNARITNLTVGSFNIVNLGVTNETVTNLILSSMTGANIAITGTSNLAGANISGFNGILGTWIDLPVGGGYASGIGSGGPGTNPFFAYAGNAGFWFTDAVPGDNCYRNQAGGLLFGNTPSQYNVKIQNYVVTVQSTNNSTNTSNGAFVITNGGAGIYGNANIGQNLTVYSTSDTIGPTIGGSIITFGGLSVAKSVDIGANINATNVSTGSLTVSGGAGFNGDIYAKNIYSNSTLLTPVVFGSNYNYIRVAGTISSSSTNFGVRTSITTGSLVGGTYHIIVNYVLGPNSSTTVNSEFQAILDATALSTGTLISQTIVRPVNTTNRLEFSRVITRTLTSGLHNVGIIWRTQTNGQAAIIDDASIEIYRVQ